MADLYVDAGRRAHPVFLGVMAHASRMHTWREASSRRTRPFFTCYIVTVRCPGATNMRSIFASKRYSVDVAACSSCWSQLVPSGRIVSWSAVACCIADSHLSLEMGRYIETVFLTAVCQYRVLTKGLKPTRWCTPTRLFHSISTTELLYVGLMIQEPEVKGFNINVARF